MVNIDSWIDGTYCESLEYKYEKHAKKVEKICKEILAKAEIQQYVITWRVKKPDSLRDKLKKMSNRFTSEKDFEKVPDITGVRIALYLPGQKKQVTNIIEKDLRFIINPRDTTHHPEIQSAIDDEGRPKYKATHLIVSLADDSETKPVEIQVMSVLGSAWAQIQHDYEYKEVHADISPAERSTLNSFGRAVDLSEGLLDRLGEQRSEQENRGFDNIYDLGSFLCEWRRRENLDPHVGDLGSLNALLELVKLGNMKQPLSSRKQLIDFLKKHVTASSVDEIKNTFRDRGVKVRLVVIIIYSIIKTFDSKPQPPQPEVYKKEREYNDKLTIIMSTVLWLSELFSPPDWEKQLLNTGGSDDKERVERAEQLLWLDSGEPLWLFQHRAEFDNHRGNIDDLWELFRNHCSPVVWLAFNIANAGIHRDIQAEIDLFNRVYMKLSYKLKNERDNINKMP